MYSTPVNGNHCVEGCGFCVTCAQQYVLVAIASKSYVGRMLLGDDVLGVEHPFLCPNMDCAVPIAWPWMVTAWGAQLALAGNPMPAAGYEPPAPGESEPTWRDPID